MTINSFKPINGTLSLGSGPLAVESQVLACELIPTEKVKETDPIPVLSGEELEGSSSQSVSYRLKFTVLQDLRSAGLVKFSYDNAGVEVPFVFAPTDEADHAASFSGDAIVVPIKVGGKVSKTDPAQSDCDWRIVGTPVPDWPGA